jgi:hypothetical protein
MKEHDLCRCLLNTARDEARVRGIYVPPGLKAVVISGTPCYFMEAKKDSPRIPIEADCTYDAKAKFIMQLINRHQAVRASKLERFVSTT